MGRREIFPSRRLPEPVSKTRVVPLSRPARDINHGRTGTSKEDTCDRGVVSQLVITGEEPADGISNELRERELKGLAGVGISVLDLAHLVQNEHTHRSRFKVGEPTILEGGES